MMKVTRQQVRADLGASVVVVLVAVPLSLGIAVASGAPLIAGLISAVIGGIVAGALGGSAVQVSGPAAGLTLIVAQTITTFGWRGACAITVAAGTVQVILGASRVARVALAVSPAVVHGMLAGVGAVIVLSQLHILLGDAPQASALANLLALPGELLRAHSHSVIIGLLTLVVLWGWRRLPLVSAPVPAPLAAITAGTLAAVITGWDVQRVRLPDQLFTLAGTPRWPDGDLSLIVVAVGAVALVASVESLLSAVAVDRMHTGPRVALDRELAGQGMANIIAGALGGLPVAGVIVRSTTNVTAGARTRLATVLHGLWIVVLVVAATPMIELIPLPALAALLVYTGAQMVNVAHAQQVHRHRETPVYLVAFTAVIVLGLFEGVLAGVLCAIAVAVWRLTHAHVRAYADDARWHVTADGSLTFLAVPKLVQALAAIPACTAVTIELHTDFMDHAAISALHDWRTGHERAGGTVEVHELHHHWYQDSLAGRKLPTRKARPTPSWRPLWPHRGSHPTAATARDRLLHGARLFHRQAAPHIAPLLAHLADTGQQPTQLFITCADARIVPSLITASGPGDLFTVRNVGNLVPRHGAHIRDDSVLAAVDYALNVLQVDTITICGHSHCGAMAALLCPPDDTMHMPHLRRWLQHAHPAPPAVADTESDQSDLLGWLGQHNVIAQLDNLMTHPPIRDRISTGRLELVGMYFDLATSRVHLLDAHERTFRPVEVPHTR